MKGKRHTAEEIIKKLATAQLRRQGMKVNTKRVARIWRQEGLRVPQRHSESFNSRLRDELLNREVFATLAEAKVLGSEYRRACNEQRLHSSLDYQTPAEFAQRNPPNQTQHPNQVASHCQTLIDTGSNSGGRSKGF